MVKNFRHERVNHKHDNVEIHPKQCGTKDNKQNPQNHDFWAEQK